MNVFDTMLKKYDIQTTEEYQHACREVLQQIALAGLYRGNFFEKAAFYGGTCLRIFYDLERFSEDMDFSLLVSDSDFSLTNYFEAIKNEFRLCGREILLEKKQKNIHSHIESAFLKDDTMVYNLSFTTEKQLKIKIEVDKNPPLGFRTEYNLRMLPYSFMVRCFVLSDLFAGKMHALTFRKWNNRVKGRDWFDFEWYIRNNTPLHFDHLKERIAQSQPINNDYSKEEFLQMLHEKIENVNISMIKQDIIPFIQQPTNTNIWSKAYFHLLADKISWE